MSKAISQLLCFCIATLCDWLKSLAPLSQPIRSKTKTNCDWLARVFPRLAPAICIELVVTPLSAAYFTHPTLKRVTAGLLNDGQVMYHLQWFPCVAKVEWGQPFPDEFPRDLLMWRIPCLCLLLFSVTPVRVAEWVHLWHCIRLHVTVQKRIPLWKRFMQTRYKVFHLGSECLHSFSLSSYLL